MTLGLTSVLCGSLCCPNFYDTWFYFCSVWVSILSEFLCHLVSLPLCVGLYVVLSSLLLLFYLYVRACVTCYGRSFHFSLKFKSLLVLFLLAIVFFNIRILITPLISSNSSYSLIVSGSTDIMHMLMICKTGSAKKKKVKFAHNSCNSLYKL